MWKSINDTGIYRSVVLQIMKLLCVTVGHREDKYIQDSVTCIKKDAVGVCVILFPL